MKRESLTQQQGVTLIVAMIMLLILTMVGVSTMKDATIQERLSSNGQQSSLARINAHSALGAAELFLENLNLETEEEVLATFTDTSVNEKNGLYIPLLRLAESQVSQPTSNMKKPDNWTDQNSIVVTTTPAGAEQSRFFVEYIGPLVDERTPGNASLDAEDKKKTVRYPLSFRITAIGFGDTDNSAAILQSIYSTQQGVL